MLNLINVRRGGKRLIPVCLYEGLCQFKAQDRKTKLPLCRNFNRESGSYNLCNQQFYATAWLMAKVGGVEELRRIRFNKTP